ncbi:GNAT family N-acetyltransferase [Amycolatopsis acidicola]|uniref:GNAT family N-acetyltransferase n=1 Tax=Amycolatopsis acidicola TaxID=2596893 RepID=A0A5N0UNZ8_9PSEU|nr:GNAT family N-acetyltransferase [Amycolatopsis acidicola]KAA9152178.1 GNAT family N-acetyltransferase [Amycolatopsis acidicola]
MTDFEVRPLAEGERREAFFMLGRALHFPALDDETWERRGAGFPAERRFGAFAGGELIGLAGSAATELAVPGGRAVPAAAVDGVGVRADHTRRGVLTALMGEQLRDCARRGEPLAALHASETAIYGRFGYGIATRAKTLRIHRARAAFRADAPAGGRVRLVPPEEAEKVLPALYHRIGPRRPGMIARGATWWRWTNPRLREGMVAVHTGPDGDDGFVAYRSENRQSFTEPEAGAALVVRDLHAANMAARAALWRFLLSVDLVAEVRAPNRPLDEPVGAMLADPRACETIAVDDGLWLRLVDVQAALSARSYGTGAPVVLEVSDPVLPENSGRYSVSADAVTRTDAPADLRLDVDVLAMLYLGDQRVSGLAELNRIHVLTDDAPARGDALFGSGIPWCGTPF